MKVIRTASAAVGFVLVCLFLVSPVAAQTIVSSNSACVGDVNSDATVTVDEILQSVNHALEGCDFMDVTINFAAMVGDEPFACGDSYDDIGLSNETIIPSDFRFYVHNIRLVDHQGREVPVALHQDGIWQYDDLALLDFEDKISPCNLGTVQTNTAIHGRVPHGEYDGIRFSLGVPFRHNHQEAATAPSPLVLTAMFWNWQGGFKFLRIDEATDLVRVHLGSTGCEAINPTTVSSCSHPNRGEIILPSFDPDHDVIVANMGALFAGADLSVNQEGTPPGCMSGQADEDCHPIFEAMGVNFHNGMPDPSRQTFFHLMGEHGHDEHSEIHVSSDAPGGGALQTTFDFADEVAEVTESACLGGTGDHCEGGTVVYSGTIPGFAALEADDGDAGAYRLNSGTPIQLEVIAADAAASFHFEDGLVAPGSSVHIGDAPELHGHGQWQIALPGGEDHVGSEASISFRFTTTAGEYSASPEYTIRLVVIEGEHQHEHEHEQ